MPWQVCGKHGAGGGAWPEKDSRQNVAGGPGMAWLGFGFGFGFGFGLDPKPKP